MGNMPSCISIAHGGGCASSSSAAASAATKVIHADGTVTRLARPVRASELMQEHPGQFVCDAGRLAVGCRVPGVAADEVLEPRRAYFLLPMDMLYSVLTDEEMAALSSVHAATAASSSWKRITTGCTRGGGGGGSPRAKDGCGDGAKVFPVVNLLQADLGSDQHERAAAVKKSSGAAGLRRHRPWQPVLDTIEEVP
ncbi:hypothetical protein ACP70R_030344 [Stipagrostis hirtigluma subsp. patula]